MSVAARVQVIVDDGRKGQGPAGGDTHHGVAGPRGEGGRYTAAAARADNGPRRGRGLPANGQPLPHPQSEYIRNILCINLQRSRVFECCLLRHYWS